MRSPGAHVLSCRCDSPVDCRRHPLSYEETVSKRIRSDLCWHYLSSRQVTLQVLSAQMSLTSVFGMGTGGPSSQSIPTRMDGFPHRLCQNPCSGFNCFYLTPHSFPKSRNITLARYGALYHVRGAGDPYRIRTDVKGVRGLCLNHLTNGPLVHLHGLEPGTH